MTKKWNPLSSLLAVAFIAPCFSNIINAQVRDKWNGVVQFTQKMTGDFIRINEKKVGLSITNSVVTDSVVYKADHSMTTAAGTAISKKNCDGKGTGELHAVDISGDEYYVHIITHTYNCTSITTEEGTVNFTEQTDITFSGNFFNSNHDVLSGSDTTTVDSGAGIVQTITTWYLTRGPLDVELIVTPSDYNRWMPIPGINEVSKGNVMNIGLKLQKRNGQPATLKAEYFELTLSTTSKERGTTINMPLSPAATQLPDLRFIPTVIAESISDDQTISVNSQDGATGIAFLASYDGGGWTTLTAVAVLEGGLRIEGKLLTPSGPVEIPIPRRDPGSQIASRWFELNGTYKDTADSEPSPGNKHKGDGYSAYEEYRGVISMGKHKRLDPKRKELGILPRRSEIGTFSLGFTRFQDESGVLVILYDKSEVLDNRRINNNGSYAQVFKQYVLRLYKGNTADEDIYNRADIAWGLTYGGHDIPARVTHVVVDVDRILSWYQYAFRAWGGGLPFTGGDLVASTTAHEIGHAVGLPHHGLNLERKPGFTAPRDTIPNIRIFTNRGTNEVTQRPYTLEGVIGYPNNHESGNVSCFMCYRNKTTWVQRIVTNQEHHFFYVPMLPAGTIFCFDQAGTDINANNKFYGNAINGSCLQRIKLKD